MFEFEFRCPGAKMVAEITNIYSKRNESVEKYIQLMYVTSVFMVFSNQLMPTDMWFTTFGVEQVWASLQIPSKSAEILTPFESIIMLI